MSGNTDRPVKKSGWDTNSRARFYKGEHVLQLSQSENSTMRQIKLAFPEKECELKGAGGADLLGDWMEW